MNNKLNDIEVKNGIIKYFGETIFPLKIKVILEKFGEPILGLAEDGYLVVSHSMMGLHPTMMKKVKGYIELSNKGWEYYETLKNNQQ